MKQTTVKAKAGKRKADTSPVKKTTTTRTKKTTAAGKTQKEKPLTNGTTKRKKAIAEQTNPDTEEQGTSSQHEEEPFDAAESQEERIPKVTKRATKRTTALAAADDEVSKKKAKTTVKAKEKKATVKTTVTKKQKVALEVPKLPQISGVLFVVGDNSCGQLGLGEDIMEKKKPFKLEFDFKIVDIVCGGMHSVCLTDRGEVWTFGCNDEGALGRVTENAEIPETIPGKVKIPQVVVKVSAGDSHSAALTENGEVYIWGNYRSNDGAMGLTGPGIKSFTPVRIMNGIKVTNIASGNDHLVCLASDGTVYTCGCGENGQLGRVSERSSKGDGRKGLNSLLLPDSVPVKVGKVTVFIDDIWTAGHSTFLKSRDTGAIYACGLNNFCQLGLKNSKNPFVPKPVSSFKSDLHWKQICGGQHHTLALDGDGKVYSIGRRDYGLLGLGEDADFASQPTLIPTLEDEECVEVSAGNMCSFSVSKSGKAFSWGQGGFHLGHSSEDDDVYVPTVIRSLLDSWNVINVSSGSQHALILANKKETT